VTGSDPLPAGRGWVAWQCGGAEEEGGPKCMGCDRRVWASLKE
jgi:hypothetical protein